MSSNLQPVDRAEIVILADNYCEQVILSNDRVLRPGGLTVKPGESEAELKAEHGFSAVVRLFRGEEVRTVMIDAGRSGTVAVENAAWAGVDLGDVEALVISTAMGIMWEGSLRWPRSLLGPSG